MDIYGKYRDSLDAVMNQMAAEIEDYAARYMNEAGDSVYEHLRYRVKSEKSMEKKLASRGLPLESYAALREVKDAIGFRIISRFVDDIYKNISCIKAIPGVQVVKEKNYILHVKPNGYRSYHMILSVEAPFEDADGNNPGRFFVEVQLRTIAMDSWASLEHEMKYKQDIGNAALISKELKRCADELASCDLSMQTIRHLIRNVKGEK